MIPLKGSGRRRARRRHRRTERELTAITRSLRTTQEAEARAALLAAASEATYDLAELSPLTTSAEDDPAEALMASSALLGRLASTETISAVDDPRTRNDWAHRWAGVGCTAEQALWVELATTRNRTRRAEIIEAIYPYAMARLGPRATEAFAGEVLTERRLALARRARHPVTYPSA